MKKTKKMKKMKKMKKTKREGSLKEWKIFVLIDQWRLLWGSVVVWLQVWNSNEFRLLHGQIHCHEKQNLEKQPQRTRMTLWNQKK